MRPPEPAELDLAGLMREAVQAAVCEVEAGGLPFVGLVVDPGGYRSGFGVNEVARTGDPMAHAEIVAMRQALTDRGAPDLAGTHLLATGEPCGLCYRFAARQRISSIWVAVDSATVAGYGFDYRSGYAAFGTAPIPDADAARLLPVDGGTAPFTRYLARKDSR